MKSIIAITGFLVSATLFTESFANLTTRVIRDECPDFLDFNPYINVTETESYFLQSPNWPGKYPENSECHWSFLVSLIVCIAMCSFNDATDPTKNFTGLAHRLCNRTTFLRNTESPISRIQGSKIVKCWFR